MIFDWIEELNIFKHSLSEFQLQLDGLWNMSDRQRHSGAPSKHVSHAWLYGQVLEVGNGAGDSILLSGSGYPVQVLLVHVALQDKEAVGLQQKGQDVARVQRGIFLTIL